MAFDQEIKAALRILEAVTEGAVSPADSFALVEEADPALVYLIFTWIRHRYGPSHAASDAVLGRMLAISNHPSIAKKMKAGHEDPVVEWFEDAYSYRELEANDFVALIVDKLES